MTRVLIVDDHAPFRKGVARLLRATPEVVEVGEAEDGQQALDAATRADWDVVLLDIGLPKLNGLVVLRLLKDIKPGMRVIMLTLRLNKLYVHDALKSGAEGYVTKETAADELLPAMRSVLSGERYIGQKARKLLDAPL